MKKAALIALRFARFNSETPSVQAGGVKTKAKEVRWLFEKRLYATSSWPVKPC